MKRLVPPLWFLLCLGLMAILDWKFRIKALIHMPWALLGFIPILLAIWMAISAARMFFRAGTTIKPLGQPKKLITTGVYRFSRNPIYLADALGLFGAWILMGMHSAILGVILFVVIIDRFQIRHEEKVLSETFGQEFEEYRKRTRRWI